jgi:serine/threonine protein kinase
LPKELQPGDELDHGKYRLIRTLGRGGMGSVFEAEHTTSHKRVAIKCLHPERARSAHGEQRLLSEARAAARVEHPNAVVIYDVGWDDGAVFLVMECLKGETFKAALARGSLLPHECIALLLPGMRAVAAAHKRGVIHRDITPSNIFLAEVQDTPGPVTKILDFGISKILQPAEPSLLQTEAAVGTPLYMPYEQLAAEPDVDHRADVYAFGVVLYEALTGRLPYTAKSIAELAGKMLEGPPAPPKELRPDLPSTLSKLVIWALARERDERIASLDEFTRELEPFSTLRSFQAELTDSMSMSSSQERAPRVPSAPSAPARLPITPAPAASPIPNTPNTRKARASVQRVWVWLIAVTAIAVATYAATTQREPAVQSRASEVSHAQAFEAHAPAPAQPKSVAMQVPPSPPASEATHAAVEPESGRTETTAATPESGSPAAAREPETGHVAARTKRSPPRARSEPVAALAAPSAPPPSAALIAAHERRAADIARLRKQLVSCGDLQTDWLRAQCKDRTKRELAEREEDYELADPSSAVP